MKLIEKLVTTPSGQSLHWHAIIGTDVDIQTRRMLVTFGSWETMMQARSRTLPARSGVMEVYFQQWDPGMLYAAPEILVASGELAGGVIVDLTPQPVAPEPLVIAGQDGVSQLDEVFDVGAMP